MNAIGRLWKGKGKVLIFLEIVEVCKKWQFIDSFQIIFAPKRIFFRLNYQNKTSK